MHNWSILTDWYPKRPSVKKHEIRSDPISADPICPFPTHGIVYYMILYHIISYHSIAYCIIEVLIDVRPRAALGEQLQLGERVVQTSARTSMLYLSSLL